MYITVPDHRIVAANRARPGAENEERSILYRDEQGELHKIDLATCVENYCKERGIDPTGVTCVGERDRSEGYFEFWTCFPNGISGRASGIGTNGSVPSNAF